MTIKKPKRPLTDPSYETIPEGTTLHRVHPTKYGPTNFNKVFGYSRFAHFNSQSGGLVSSLYASSTMQTAIHETIFHDIPANQTLRTVPIKDIHKRTHSVLTTKRDIKLVGLRNIPLSRWSISRKELIESSPKLYKETVLWAEAIHWDISDAEGLVWTSKQNDTDDTFLFFGDRVSEDDFACDNSRHGFALDGDFLTDVRTEANNRRITITR
jgi:hypothetical protein